MESNYGFSLRANFYCIREDFKNKKDNQNAGFVHDSQDEPTGIFWSNIFLSTLPLLCLGLALCFLVNTGFCPQILPIGKS